MARYSTTISSALAPADAFAYMADFSNARFWDPSVSEAARKDDGPIGLGSAFAIVARFAGRDVPLTYAIVAYEPPVKVVLEARRGFVSRDTITVEEAGERRLASCTTTPCSRSAASRLLVDPLMQLVFGRVGAKAKAGLEAALNP